MEFKKQVEKFWSDFEKNVVEYEQHLQNKNLNYVNEKIAELLKEFRSVTSVKIEYNYDGTYDLFLISYNKLDMYINYYITSFVQPNLFSKWNFHFTQPAVLENSLYNNEIVDDKIYISIVVKSEVTVDLNVYTELQINKNSIKYLIKRALGDTIYMTLIDKVNIVREINSNSFTINYLNDRIIALQEMGVVKNITTPFERLEVYEMENDTNGFLRDDIYTGMYLLNQPYNAYYTLDDSFFENYYTQGIYFGYISFAVEEYSEEELQTINEFLLYEIVKIFEINQLGKFIGTALGNNFSYLDFIIYNLEEGIEALKYIIETNNLPVIYFSTLDKNAQVIKI